MGLMDVLNGMRNGPGGQVGRQPLQRRHVAAHHGGPGLPCLQGLQRRRPVGAGDATDHPIRLTTAGDWLGGLTKAITGGAGGSILTGGLGELFNRLQHTGHGATAQSWVGTGPNQSISPDALEKALGADTLDELTRKTGMTREHLLETLSREMPATIDQLTPAGRLPNDQEAARWAS
jgi:uncharacterized protein YidB (DUF937 family)